MRPLSRAKAMAIEIERDNSGDRLKELNCLFDSCFRIQREACEAAGRHIPMIVENVRGAQRWVGRARWSFGSFYLWSDVPALMPMTLKIAKAPGQSMNQGYPKWNMNHMETCAAIKLPGFRFDGSGRSFQSASVEGRKIGGDWFSDPQSTCRRHGSKSPARKMAAAMIAKIPEPLARHIARVFRPVKSEAA